MKLSRYLIKLLENVHRINLWFLIKSVSWSTRLPSLSTHVLCYGVFITFTNSRIFAVIPICSIQCSGSFSFTNTFTVHAYSEWHNACNWANAFINPSIIPLTFNWMITRIPIEEGVCWNVLPKYWNTYPSGFWYRGKKKILMAHVDETCAIFDVSRLFTIFSMFT